MERFSFFENGLYLEFEVSEEKQIRLLHFSALPLRDDDLIPEEARKAYHLYEMRLSGFPNEENHSMRYLGSLPGLQMRYVSHQMEETGTGKRLTITTKDSDTGLIVRSYFEFYDGVPAVRCWNEVINEGTKCYGLEFLSSFQLAGFDKDGLRPAEEKMQLHFAHNAWQSESQWRSGSLGEFGYSSMSSTEDCSKRVQRTSVGSWSTCEYLPIGVMENTEKNVSLFWQIETNGGWHWEISDLAKQTMLSVSGPTEAEHHWWKRLAPGESFATVPVCAGSVIGGREEAVRALTKYRRALCGGRTRTMPLPVIFNDYMNCLWASPTTEKELPMIRAAAKIGCEYYVVDAGWYTDGNWWYAVGEWLPSQKRFPNGLKEVMDAIRAAGMIPGIWLEIETMGIECPKLKDCDDSWFFMRHGSRIVVRGRYQLDFSNPAVRAFASETVKRVVEEYGVGYIKMDYNINAGIGSDQDSDSCGDGLLRHERAYLAWLDGIRAQYPSLIIENCASGAMRMDYAMMARSDIQSTSDQDDVRKYVSIAVNAPAALLPEQAGVWCYPQRKNTREEIIFNLVNAALLRMQVSGNLDELDANSHALMREGIEFHKGIREKIRGGLPYWPLGFARNEDKWAALAIESGDTLYLGVWRKDSEDTICTLKLPQIRGKKAEAAMAFPANDTACEFELNAESGTLTVKLPETYMARILEIRISD